MSGYLLDEHLPAWWPSAILARQPQLVVRAVGDGVAPPKGTPDPDLLIWGEANDAILITNDRSTMSRHLADHLAAGRHSPGVFLMNPRTDIDVLANSLFYLMGASLPGEWQDLVSYPPLIVP